MYKDAAWKVATYRFIFFSRIFGPTAHYCMIYCANDAEIGTHATCSMLPGRNILSICVKFCSVIARTLNFTHGFRRGFGFGACYGLRTSDSSLFAGQSGNCCITQLQLTSCHLTYFFSKIIQSVSAPVIRPICVKCVMFLDTCECLNASSFMVRDFFVTMVKR